VIENSEALLPDAGTTDFVAISTRHTLRPGGGEMAYLDSSLLVSSLSATKAAALAARTAFGGIPT
jgi:hypothetical protein